MDDKELSLAVAGLIILVAPQVVVVAASIAVGLKFGAWAGFAAFALSEAVVATALAVAIMAGAGDGR